VQCVLMWRRVARGVRVNWPPRIATVKDPRCRRLERGIGGLRVAQEVGRRHTIELLGLGAEELLDVLVLIGYVGVPRGLGDGDLGGDILASRLGGSP